MKYIFWPVVLLLVVGWVLGFIVFKVLGVLIHLLLLVAIGLILYNWYLKRKVRASEE
ncbi:lmo0937 family membrane protein [Pareuzebyella sediminis]|uniref:lmo0937 family membrane protein n=1 Tax=Pareuzebyella sediminis TaxID=2607998 RepID=UPI0011ED5139|nr:lmo0937 family membrane protein [Pareuzebyella sediminis]